MLIIPVYVINKTVNMFYTQTADAFTRKTIRDRAKT